MSYRFITKSIHAYVIDYPFAIVLIAAPFVLKLGQSEPVAMWLSVVVGVAALLLPALTDHPSGSSASFPTGCTFGSIAPSGWCLSSRRLPSNSLGSTPGTTGSSLPVSCSRRQSSTRLRSQSRRVRDWTCAQRVEGGDGVVEGRDVADVRPQPSSYGRATMRTKFLAMTAVVTSGVIATAFLVQSFSSSSAQTQARQLPEYTASGDLVLPKNFHEWIYGGS